MKKLLFLCCTMLCGISAFSQISFNQSASTVTSGQQVTLTSTGENHSSAPGNKYINNLDQFSVVSASPSSYLSSQTIVWSGGNYSTLSTPTVIIATLTNTASVPVTVTYKFRVFTYDNWGFFNLPPYDQSFTVTVNPVPVITYHSVALSQTFTKNSLLQYHGFIFVNKYPVVKNKFKSFGQYGSFYFFTGLYHVMYS
jgi:uncharacterized protein YcfL